MLACTLSYINKYNLVALLLVIALVSLATDKPLGNKKPNLSIFTYFTQIYYCNNYHLEHLIILLPFDLRTVDNCLYLLYLLSHKLVFSLPLTLSQQSRFCLLFGTLLSHLVVISTWGLLLATSLVCRCHSWITGNPLLPEVAHAIFT